MSRVTRCRWCNIARVDGFDAHCLECASLLTPPKDFPCPSCAVQVRELAREVVRLQTLVATYKKDCGER